VGHGEAVEDVHQGRLAGAVLAEQGVDLAGPDLEIDVVIGDHARVTLGDAAHFQRWHWRRRWDFVGWRESGWRDGRHRFARLLSPIGRWKEKSGPRLLATRSSLTNWPALLLR